jgi:uncharacterized hydrophobic protein (TIGR00271 family)
VSLLQKFFHYLDLRSEVEGYDVIHSEIEKGVTFKGTNLWILVFAIVVASVGLNTNSTAVIIGAMLISPLMGPINGMGYSIATYNFELFRKSVRNFGFAVGASLVASSLYFLITPVSVAHSELLSRTNPTIYDVLIALFGGLAGIIAISSKLKGNVIPGVAIATALMPPLCTAGYGIAVLRLDYFFGAFYLFTINTVFIGIASLIISRLLEFPIRTVIDPSRKQRINQYMWTIIFITLLPSIYFGYRLVQNERFVENVNKFTTSEISFFEGVYLIKSEVDVNNKKIRLIYGGNSLTTENKEEIKNLADKFGLENAKLVISQGFSLNDASKDANNTNTETDALRSKLNALTLTLQQNEQKADSIAKLPLLGKQILAEIKPIYKQVNACSYSETYIFTDSTKNPQKTALVTFSVTKNSIRETDIENINNWLKARLNNTFIKTYFEEIKN